jgi:hypothetical protein
VRASLYVPAEAGQAGDVVYVRAVLRIVRHPRRGSRGQFGGFVEYRLDGVGEVAPTAGMRQGVKCYHPPAVS